MFTINDIKPLVMVDGAKAVIIKEATKDELDIELKKIIEKQIKKATKLPVIWIPAGVEIEVSQDDYG